MKALSARCLTTSGLPHEFWSYAVKYAAQSLLCTSLQRKQRSPPFGSQAVAQVLGHKKVRYPKPRTMSGRLLYWDHLQDQLSYLLCQPGDEDESHEEVVQRADCPVLSPPETPDPKATFGTPLKSKNSRTTSGPGWGCTSCTWRSTNGSGKGWANIELDLLEGTPFTYLYLSSEESTKVLHAEEEEDDDVILMEEVSPPTTTTKKDPEEEEGKQQATTHISISPDVVLASQGGERQKWLAAGKKEIDNLTLPKAITALSPQEKNVLKEKA